MLKPNIYILHDFTKEVSCLEVSFFVMSAYKKLIQIWMLTNRKAVFWNLGQFWHDDKNKFYAWHFFNRNLGLLGNTAFGSGKIRTKSSNTKVGFNPLCHNLHLLGVRIIWSMCLLVNQGLQKAHCQGAIL